MKHTQLDAAAVAFASMSLLALAGCGGGSTAASYARAGYGGTSPASSGSAYYAPEAHAGSDAPPPAAAEAPSSASVGGEAVVQYGGGGGAGTGSMTRAPEPPPEYRPGLATEWGETRHQPIAFEPFVRATPTTPFATTAIRYNDAQGAMAQAAFRGGAAPVQYIGAYNGGVHVSLRDEHGAPLPGQIVGDSLYVIGEHGQRYTIVVENRTPARFEAVVTVDGLDVMNGQPGSLTHRGYILRPYATLAVEGFRQSHNAVAAFRFGTVADSYAAQTGSARNVGVIGVALFHEAGAVLAPMPVGEIELRESANPFPGGYATPPAVRRYY